MRCSWSSSLFWWVTGGVGGVRAENRGEPRGGVTVGDYGGATFGTGATVGSGAGSKKLGGGIRFVLWGAGCAGCKGLTGCAVVVSVVLARIVLSLVSSLRGDDCRCWGILFLIVAVRFYMDAMTASAGVKVGLERYFCL